MIHVSEILSKKPVLGIIGSISPSLITGVVENIHPWAQLLSIGLGVGIGFFTLSIKWFDWREKRREFRRSYKG